MSYIKRKRDRRDYELRRLFEAHMTWRPQLILESNMKAIEEEIAIGNQRLWVHEPMTITPIWGNR